MGFFHRQLLESPTLTLPRPAAEGDNGGDNGAGGTPDAVPLPAAAYAFPFGAAFAGYFYRRMRRHA